MIITLTIALKNNRSQHDICNSDGKIYVCIKLITVEKTNQSIYIMFIIIKINTVINSNGNCIGNNDTDAKFLHHFRTLSFQILHYSVVASNAIIYYFQCTVSTNYKLTSTTYVLFLDRYVICIASLTPIM